MEPGPADTGPAGTGKAQPEPAQPEPAATGPAESDAAVVGRLPMLLEAVLSVGSDLDLGSTLQQIVETATALTGARHGALAVLEPDRDRIDALYTTGTPEAEAEGSFLRAPIAVHTEVFGHLYLGGKRPGPFTDTDSGLLRVLAAQAGIAIGNARLYGTARQRERWIAGAAAVTTALLTGTDAADALMTVAEQARVLADASAGVILQPTEEGGMEIVTASTPDDPAGIVGTVIEPGSPVLVQLLGGEPVFIDDSATDPRMTTGVRSRFGPSMMLPLQSGGRLIGTLALPRRRGERPYTDLDRLLATQFASQAALALVLADAQADREQLAVYEDRDRIARDLHDLVVQRLFATEMMLESTRRRAASEEESRGAAEAGGGGEVEEQAEAGVLLGRAVDELDSTIQEVRTAIFALQQPPAAAPSTFRGRVLRETGGAAALLGFPPSVQFTGAVDALVGEETGRELLAALRGALAAAHRRPGVSAIEVEVDAPVRLPDGRSGVRLVVADDGRGEDDGRPTTVTWQAPI
ncbi:putative two-component system sensor kinase [Streptomyces sp. HCCB10043]|nr:putative two-component system sensor kinase [Streptomyces sp. HCCB10043]EWS91371.1 two-component system sensor kinase [Streptomyces filamentosus NRRL 11379]